jgi:hypothetical protein
MRAKAVRVQARVRDRAERRRTRPPLESRTQKSYKVVAISLYSDQAESVDRATQELLDAGYPRASRSLVIQAAIERLRQDLDGRSRDEVVRYFVERHPRRSLAAMPSREPAKQLQLFYR